MSTREYGDSQLSILNPDQIEKKTLRLMEMIRLEVAQNMVKYSLVSDFNEFILSSIETLMKQDSKSNSQTYINSALINHLKSFGLS